METNFPDLNSLIFLHQHGKAHSTRDLNARSEASSSLRLHLELGIHTGEVPVEAVAVLLVPQLGTY